jgi:putative transposase
LQYRWFLENADEDIAERYLRAVDETIRLVAQRPDACWSMDFVADALFDGRRFRALTVVDNFTKECLAIEVAAQLRSEDVVRVMERLRLQRGLPTRIQTDNGTEFASLAMDRWAYERQVTLDFSRPGRKLPCTADTGF